MKLFRHKIILLIAIAFFSSCHSALHVTKVELKYPSSLSPNMEFLGFKNMNRNNVLVKDFGLELERSNIAFNKQGFYMGAFNLQELAAYNTQERYVTFLDVVRQTYSHSDAIHDKNGLAVGGWVIAVTTVFTLFPVYVPMLCVSDANDCQISLICEYNLIVYDTQKKEVVINVPIEVNVKDMYKGQYAHKETNRHEVDNHYKTILYNILLENYAQVHNQINKLSK